MAKLRQLGGDDGPVLDPAGRDPQLPGPSGGPLAPPEPPGLPPPDGAPGGNSTPPREGPGLLQAKTPLSAGNATPPMPMSPTPQAGGSGPAMPPMPFEPLPSPGPGAYASPRLRGLFGGSGGLTEGGLGVPGGGEAQGPDQLSALIQQLLSNKGY